MKKLLMIVFVFMIASVSIFSTGCGAKDQGADSDQKNNQKVEKKEEKQPAKESSMQDIFDAVNASFDEYEVVTMGMKIDDQVLQDVFHIDPTLIEDYAGEMSFSMENSDVLLGVKAKDENLNTVINAMQQKLTELKEQFAAQPDSAAYARVNNGEVYIKGNSVFLIVIGVLEDGDAQGPFDFSKDRDQAEEVIDGFFK